MSNLKKTIIEWWKKTSLRQKIVIGAAGCFFVISLFFAGIFGTKTEYRLLFSNMEAEEAGEIVDWLKQEQIKFRLQEGGNTILVPEEKLYDIRLQLAGKGLPKSKTIGFEIFDQSSFGTTEFVQHLNYIRALQGELSRTIGHLEQIEEANVHIARPKASIFRRKKQRVTASVVLQLKNGRTLTSKEIYGISHLVAGAVEGLRTENISILDQKGKLLSRKAMRGDAEELLPSLDMQKKFENHLREKAQSMLDQVLGKERAIVRINVEMNFDKSKEIIESVDPDKQIVVSETIRKRKSSENTPLKGTGSRNKVQKRRSSSNKFREEQDENRDTTYAFDKRVKEIESKGGEVKRLSIALVVDKELAEQLTSIGKVIKKCVGFDEKRGDSFEYISVPFHKPEKQTFTPMPFWEKNYRLLSLLIRQGTVALGILVFGIVLMMFFKKSKKIEGNIVDGTSMHERSMEEGISAAEFQALRAKGEEEEKDKPDPLIKIIEDARSIAKENTNATSAVLRLWFYEEESQNGTNDNG